MACDGRGLAPGRGTSVKMLDSLILALSNAALYAAHPRLVQGYRRRVGRLPNIANPRRYSERMIWRRIVDHNPQFVTFSDKLATKEYCGRVCPELPHRCRQGG